MKPSIVSFASRRAKSALVLHHQSHQRRAFATKKERVDPFAKRPNQKCDPYGQGGAPMELGQAQSLLTSTLEKEWRIEYSRQDEKLPFALYREFHHPTFLSGADFTRIIAALAEMNNHYPTISLERRIEKKAWKVISTVRCHTFVLGGLSVNDFHFAMLVDVESQKSNLQKYILQSETAA